MSWPNPNTNPFKALQYLGAHPEGVGPTELSKAINCSLSGASNALTQLKDQGLAVQKTDRGPFTLTSVGVERSKEQKDIPTDGSVRRTRAITRPRLTPPAKEEVAPSLESEVERREALIKFYTARADSLRSSLSTYEALIEAEAQGLAALRKALPPEEEVKEEEEVVVPEKGSESSQETPAQAPAPAPAPVSDKKEAQASKKKAA